MRKIQNIVLLTLTVVFLSMLAAAPALAAKPMHDASGGGLFHAPSGNEGFNLFVFAFDAHPLGVHGEATGHFLQNNLTNGNVLHLDIIHMEFMNKGNTVGLIGLVTKSIGSNAEIGDCRAVLLQDNVKNSEQQKDMRSKLSSKCDPPDFSDVKNFLLYDLDDGHIQIR
jgi:hypothetical protein